MHGYVSCDGRTFRLFGFVMKIGDEPAGPGLLLVAGNCRFGIERANAWSGAVPIGDGEEQRADKRRLTAGARARDGVGQIDSKNRLRGL